MTQEKPKSSTGMEQNVAALLCYILGWITGLIFILIEKENKYVRFHAWQSLIVFGSITIITTVFRWTPFIGTFLSAILGILAFVLWIVCMIKAYQGEKFKLPVAGDIAEKQAG